MSRKLTISETGLKLIKAFEGYRPVDRELISGHRIVGYGHRLYSDDAVIMNKAKAEEVLLSDLAPFEDMINTEVHAPLSQSQFDALCSFAFNIGPKAFLKSDTLRAINNGRLLDAANGLDIWRKSEIDGKVYVVDALMRRRTAEKALFLRTKRDVPAGSSDLRPVIDTTIVGLTTDDGLPVFTQSDAAGIVETAPYDAAPSPKRRHDDGPSGPLQLSERDVVEGEIISDESNIVDFRFEETDKDASPEPEDKPLEPLDLGPDLNLDLGLGLEPEEEGSEVETFDKPEVSESPEEPKERPSPIAAAATDIVARLDALIDDALPQFDDKDAEWPESLITAETDKADVVEDAAIKVEPDDKQNVIDLKSRTTRGKEIAEKAPTEVQTVSPVKETVSETKTPVMVIDELAQDDAFKVRTDSAAKYIETTGPAEPVVAPSTQGEGGIWVLVILGFLLVGLAGGGMMSGAGALLGEWGPIITFTGFVIGVGLILAGIYASLRIKRTG